MHKFKLIVVALVGIFLLTGGGFLLIGNDSNAKPRVKIASSDLNPGPMYSSPVVEKATQSDPQTLTVESVGINVKPVQLPTDATTLLPPEDVKSVGWWRNPETGSLVFTGHIDSKEQGLGLFSVLPRIKPGAEVKVDGLIYHVTRVEEVLKSNLPSEPFVKPGVTLITCGGEFNKSTGHYTQNIIVYTE